MPNLPIHPGEILRDEMAAWPLDEVELASAINILTDEVRQIVSGQRNISVGVAAGLGKLFSTGPLFWLNLQAAYELDLTNVAHKPQPS